MNDDDFAVLLGISPEDLALVRRTVKAFEVQAVDRSLRYFVGTRWGHGVGPLVINGVTAPDLRTALVQAHRFVEREVRRTTIGADLTDEEAAGREPTAPDAVRVACMAHLFGRDYGLWMDALPRLAAELTAT